MGIIQFPKGLKDERVVLVDYVSVQSCRFYYVWTTADDCYRLCHSEPAPRKGDLIILVRFDKVWWKTKDSECDCGCK